MKGEDYRRILDAAIEGEIEAYEFYRQVAEKVSDNFLKKMFSDFATEEMRHRRILKEFRDDEGKILHFFQAVDYHLSEAMDDPPLTVEMKPADAIALAMKKEEAAMKHYEALARASRDDGQRRVFRELAAMERGHKAKMETAFVDIGFPEVW
jgi:rubrerythrin